MLFLFTAAALEDEAPLALDDIVVTADRQLNADNIAKKRCWSAPGNNLLGDCLPSQVKLTARIAL